MAAKPSIIMAQVAGSGTAATDGAALRRNWPTSDTVAPSVNVIVTLEKVPLNALKKLLPFSPMSYRLVTCPLLLQHMNEKKKLTIVGSSLLNSSAQDRKSVV